MDLMREGVGVKGIGGDPVLLVTRDADFSPCVDALEASGTPVICLSTEPPAVRLRRACSGWVELLRSGEAHYHVRTRLQGPGPAPSERAPKARHCRKGQMYRTRAEPAPVWVDPDPVLAQVLAEEGVTPLPRLIGLCPQLVGLEAHVRSRPDLYHFSGTRDQPRVSLMTPEKAAYLALEAALIACGPLPLDRLLSEVRSRGLRSRLPHRGILRTLQARPDRFRVVGTGEQRLAELCG
jgi:hypothetical protein